MITPANIVRMLPRRRFFETLAALGAAVVGSGWLLAGYPASPPAWADDPEGRTIELSSEPGTVVLGAPGKDQLGNDLAVGEVNDDGVLDIIAGAQWGSVGGRNIVGRSYAVFGRPEWPVRMDMATGVYDWGFIGGGREARLGSAVDSGDLSGDGIGDIALGSVLGDPLGQTNGGAVFIMFGGDSAGGFVDFLDESPDVLIAGYSDTFGADQIGTDLAMGDFNSDGQTDLAVAAAHRNEFVGTVFVFFGPFSRDEVINLQTQTADWWLTGPAERAFFGASIAAGDYDGDGTADLLVGSVGRGEGTDDGGGVYVFRGHADRGGETFASEAQILYTGATGDQLGAAYSAGACSCRGSPLAVADLNGDAVPDLVVGAPQANRRAGRAYLVPGPLQEGTHPITGTARAELRGPAEGDRLGWSLSPGHLDADGILDLVIAAPWSSPAGVTNAGRFVGLRGPLHHTGVVTLTPGVGSLEIIGPQAGAGSAGASVVLADTDGDGQDDLHLGLPDEAPESRQSVGALHRFGGPLLASLPTPTASPETPTPTSDASETPMATELVTDVPSPTPTETPVEPHPTDTPTSTAPPSATPTSTPTLDPSSTPTRSPSDTPTLPTERIFLPACLRPLF